MDRLTIEYTEVVCDGWLPPAAGDPPRGPVRLALAWTALHHAECLKPHDYDDIGYTGRPTMGRDEIYVETGVDIQDMTRLPQDPREARRALSRYRHRRWDNIPPAPGDLWRLTCIALGRGDPSGCPAPGPLPETDKMTRLLWKDVIDWRSLPHGRFPHRYDTGTFDPAERFGDWL